MKLFVLALIVALVTPTSAWAASSKKGKDKSPVTTEAALEFLSSQQSEFGLIDSFSDDGTDYAYSYDNAMAAMAFISAGDLFSAARILEAFASIGPEPDGGFLHRYHSTDGGQAFGVSGVGHNAYILQAMVLYRLESGDRGFDSLAVTLASFLLAHQDLDGGLFGRAGVTWKSTENNLAAYTALHNIGTLLGIQEYIDAATGIRDFLVAECWNGIRFLTGENDPMIVSDAQALGVMVLGPAFQNGAYWVQDHTLTTRRIKRGQRVTGFDLNADRDTVWTEGTLQQALAFSVAGDPELADFYRQEAEKLHNASSGAFRQASNVGSTGFGENFNTWQAAAPTAWFVLVSNQDNALRPLW